MIFLADGPKEHSEHEGNAAVGKHAQEAVEEDDVDVSRAGAVEGIETGLVDQPFHGRHGFCHRDQLLPVGSFRDTGKACRCSGRWVR